MRNTIIAILVIMLLILAGRIILFRSSPDKKAESNDNIFANLTSRPQRGSPAPEIVLKDISGIEKKLGDYKGMPVMVNFWTVDCPPCKKEMPLLQNAAEKGEGTIAVIGINMGDPHDKVASFVQSNNIRFTILMDTDGLTSETYRVAAYPITYFIDSDGIIRDYHTGQLSEELLKSYTTKLGIPSW